MKNIHANWLFDAFAYIHKFVLSHDVTIINYTLYITIIFFCIIVSQLLQSWDRKGALPTVLPCLVISKVFKYILISLKLHSILNFMDLYLFVLHNFCGYKCLFCDFYGNIPLMKSIHPRKSVTNNISHPLSSTSHTLLCATRNINTLGKGSQKNPLNLWSWSYLAGPPLHPSFLRTVIALGYFFSCCFFLWLFG